MILRTYGKITRDPKSDMWNLRVEPHIAIKAKRLFGKIQQQIVSEMALTSTPENCRDLLWFMDRYPLVISDPDLRFMKRGAKKYDEKVLTLEKILAGEFKSERFDMALPLRDYQFAPAEILWKNGFLLCADDLGCVDGDAEVRVSRAKRGFKISLSRLFYKFNGGKSGTGNNNVWDSSFQTYIRSMCNGELRLHKINAVLDKGIRPVVKIFLESGKSLRVTPDHEVATGVDSWRRTDTLKPGDVVMTNGIPVCKGCGSADGGKAGNGGDVCFIPKEDRVVSVAPDGEAHVYDIICDDPHRNFVANGIIVHNCGKTAEAIYALSNPDTRPALVVTMAHLPRQWQEEFQKFAPGIATHILKSGTPYKLADKKTGVKPDVIITNYHKLRGWATTLEGWIKSVVFDEGQELRRCESAKYAAARQIARACKYRLSLSATPTINYGGELWNVIDVLQEDALGSRDEFEREFVRPNLWNELGSHLRETGIMLRRTKKDIGRELPEVTQVPHTIDCDEKILDNIKGSAAALARMILKESAADKGEYFRAHGEFDMLMRRATGIAKAPYVAEFIKILVESGEKVVVFGWHHAVYDIWRDRLREFNPVFFTGEESPSQKEAAKKSFVEGDSKILIISLRAGAGLDGLQYACSVCVFGELDWSDGVIKQCIGRISRDGQDKAVTAYFMLSETGADPVMCDVLEVKGQQGHAIRDPFSDLAIRTDNSADHVKKLAAHYLRSISAPEEADVFEEEVVGA